MTGGAGEDMAWGIEQACMNAWPSPRQVLLDRWLVRLSGGSTRRTNSVNPLRGFPSYDVAPVIEDCARLYAGAGRRLVFRVPDLAPGMAESLERLGYAPRAETRTLVVDLGGFEARPDPGVDLTPEPGRDWLTARARWNGADAEADAVYRTMTGLIALPKVFAALRIDGAIASLAYGALDRGLLVVESVATAEALRSRGYGKRTVARLMSWAKAGGATRACLQVVADNHPAGALYAALGFDTELYRYHYRVDGRVG